MPNLSCSIFFFLCILSATASCVGHSSSSFSSEHSKQFISGKTFVNQSIGFLIDDKKKSQIGQLEFENCTFQGKTTFSGFENIFSGFLYSCIFKNCSFEGDLYGNMTQYLGNLSFSKCRFKQNISFQNSTFLGPVAFRECTFDGSALFQNAIFQRESTWIGSHFYGIPFFQSARFFEKAQFMNVVFHSNSDFTLVKFSEGLTFDFARAEGALDFSESKFEGQSTFRKAEFSKRVVMKKIVSYSNIRFYESSFSDSLVTSGSKFFAEKIEILQSKGVFNPGTY